MKAIFLCPVIAALVLSPVLARAETNGADNGLSLPSGSVAGKQKPWTVWILGPLSLENSLGAESKLSLSVGLGGVIVDDGFSQGVELGWLVEGQMFKDSAQQGYSFGLRAGSALGGVYFAPVLSYTSRPEKKACFRASLLAPIGNNVTPFSIEVALGFRF